MSNNTNSFEPTYKTLDMEGGEFGQIQISSNVVAGIAGLAALEVKGVYSTIGSVANEIAGKFGMRNLGKGIRAVIEGNEVVIDMNISMMYGYNIMNTCSMIQDKVKQSVENMTGLECTKVNVCIAEVKVD